jgi:hypothetical protein
METRFTKHTGVHIKQRADRTWQHVDCNDKGRAAEVGPIYNTKAELLADHEAYLIRAGWLTDSDDVTKAQAVKAAGNPVLDVRLLIGANAYAVITTADRTMDVLLEAGQSARASLLTSAEEIRAKAQAMLERARLMEAAADHFH